MSIALEIPRLLLHHSPRWRDGRVVECTGLENQQGVKTFQGSNPCPSATSKTRYQTVVFLVNAYAINADYRQCLYALKLNCALHAFSSDKPSRPI